MRHRSTRSRIIVAGVLVLVLAFVALTLRLFVFPDLNAPERSNAIVVLGTHGAGSFDEGAELAKEGYAPTIAFSVPAYPFVNTPSSCSRSAPSSPLGARPVLPGRPGDHPG